MEQQVIYQVASNWLPPIPHTGFPIYLFLVLPSESSLHPYLRLVWKQFCWWSVPSLSLYHQDAGPLGAAWGSVSLARESINSTVSHTSPFNSQPSWRKKISFWLGSSISCTPGFQYQIPIFLYLGAASNNMPGLSQRNKHWHPTYHIPSCPAGPVCPFFTHRPEPPRMWSGRGEERRIERGFWGPCWRLLPSW